MCRRLPYGLLLVLVLLFLGGYPRVAGAQANPPVDRAAWATRLANLQPNSGDSIRLVQDFLQLDPEVSLTLLRDNWNNLPGPEAKIFLMSQLSQGEDPRALDILHLGATDPFLFVQSRALQWVEYYSLRSFNEDYNAYIAWYQANTGKPLEEVLRASAREVVTALSSADVDQRAALLNVLQRVLSNVSLSRLGRQRRQALVDAGLPDLLARWLPPPNSHWLAYQVVRQLRPDEAYLRRVVLPLTTKGNDPNVRREALALLGSSDNRWASDLLLKMMLDEYPDQSAEYIGQVLVQIGDPQIIPTLIAMMDTDRTPDGARVIGSLLIQIASVNTQSFSDPAWWHAWWQKNSLRFPAEVRSLPFPRLTLRTRVLPPVVEPPKPPAQHQIANDPKRAYWLITPNVQTAPAPVPNGGPPPPPIGPPGTGARPNPSAPVGLLVVLPADGNAADSVSFWTDLAQHALDGRYYVAIAAAPRWTVNQSVTWVTRRNSKDVKEAKFSTETFVADIVKDVVAHYKIDPNRIFLHGVGDSGPVVYAASLEETTSFKGFYILSSFFKATLLPPLTHAKGRRYYLQTSQEDTATPYWVSMIAQKALLAQGATVQLASYHGGHGYVFREDIHAKIRDAINWLEMGQ